MTAGDRHWQEIERLFHDALELDAPHRGAFLEEKCGDQVELRRELDALLAASDQTLGFVRDAVAQVAQQQNADPPREMTPRRGSKLLTDWDKLGARAAG